MKRALPYVVIAALLAVIGWQALRGPETPSAPPAPAVAQAPAPAPAPGGPAATSPAVKQPLPEPEPDPDAPPEQVTPAPGQDLPPVDPSLFPPTQNVAAEDDDLPPLPSFGELPERLREPGFQALADRVSDLFAESLPEARVEGVDCSSVPCLLRLSAPLALPGEQAPMASAIGLATDAAQGDRPLVITGEDDGKATATVTFTPPDQPELAGTFEEAAESRTPGR